MAMAEQDAERERDQRARARAPIAEIAEVLERLVDEQAGVVLKKLMRSLMWRDSGRALHG